MKRERERRKGRQFLMRSRLHSNFTHLIIYASRTKLLSTIYDTTLRVSCKHFFLVLDAFIGNTHSTFFKCESCWWDNSCYVFPNKCIVSPWSWNKSFTDLKNYWTSKHLWDGWEVRNEYSKRNGRIIFKKNLKRSCYKL